jgi:hypothetical protein
MNTNETDFDKKGGTEPIRVGSQISSYMRDELVSEYESDSSRWLLEPGAG